MIQTPYRKVNDRETYKMVGCCFYSMLLVCYQAVGPDLFCDGQVEPFHRSLGLAGIFWSISNRYSVYIIDRVPAQDLDALFAVGLQPTRFPPDSL